MFKDFIKKQKLYNALDADISDVPYTWMSNDQIGNRVGSSSKIDHFFISTALKDSISEYRTLSEVTNGSDHVPLLLTIDIDINMHKTCERVFKSSVAWQKCDNICIGEYKTTLDQKLLQIKLIQNMKHGAAETPNVLNILNLYRMNITNLSDYG